MKRRRFVASIIACLFGLPTPGVAAQARSEPDGSAHDVAPAASGEEAGLGPQGKAGMDRVLDEAHRPYRPRRLDAASLVGLHYGAPKGLSGAVSIPLGAVHRGSTHSSDLDTFRGPIVRAELGTGGATVGAGVAYTWGVLKELPIGVPLVQSSLRGSLTRTFWRPVGAPSGATYAGPELGLGLAFISAHVGYQWRVGGAQAAARDSLVSWAVGFGF
jgi:hypothetical protein